MLWNRFLVAKSLGILLKPVYDSPGTEINHKSDILEIIEISFKVKQAVIHSKAVVKTKFS